MTEERPETVRTDDPDLTWDAIEAEFFIDQALNLIFFQKHLTNITKVWYNETSEKM